MSSASGDTSNGQGRISVPVHTQTRRELRRRRRRRSKAVVDYEEMSVRYGSIKLQVPPGFKRLLEDLSREVLREQPKNIPRFAAAYFDRLVERREQGYADGFPVAERIVEDAPRSSPAQAREETVTVAESSPSEQVAPTVDESASSKVPEQAAEEEMPDLNDPEVEKAAAVIQAGYKGFKTRRSLTKDSDSDINHTKESVVDVPGSSTALNEEDASFAKHALMNALLEEGSRTVLGENSVGAGSSNSNDAAIEHDSDGEVEEEAPTLNGLETAPVPEEDVDLAEADRVLDEEAQEVAEELAAEIEIDAEESAAKKMSLNVAVSEEIAEEIVEPVLVTPEEVTSAETESPSAVQASSELAERTPSAEEVPGEGDQRDQAKASDPASALASEVVSRARAAVQYGSSSSLPGSSSATDSTDVLSDDRKQEDRTDTEQKKIEELANLLRKSLTGSNSESEHEIVSNPELADSDAVLVSESAIPVNEVISQSVAGPQRDFSEQRRSSAALVKEVSQIKTADGSMSDVSSSEYFNATETSKAVENLTLSALDSDVRVVRRESVESARRASVKEREAGASPELIERFVAMDNVSSQGSVSDPVAKDRKPSLALVEQSVVKDSVWSPELIEEAVTQDEIPSLKMVEESVVKDNVEPSESVKESVAKDGVRGTTPGEASPAAEMVKPNQESEVDIAQTDAAVEAIVSDDKKSGANDDETQQVESFASEVPREKMSEKSLIKRSRTNSIQSSERKVSFSGSISIAPAAESSLTDDSDEDAFDKDGVVSGTEAAEIMDSVSKYSAEEIRESTQKLEAIKLVNDVVKASTEKVRRMSVQQAGSEAEQAKGKERDSDNATGEQEKQLELDAQAKTAVKTERRDSSVAAESRDSHVSLERRDSSVTTERRDSYVTTERRDSSVPMERRDSHVATERRDSSVSAERRDSSVPTERRDSSVSEGVEATDSLQAQAASTTEAKDPEAATNAAAEEAVSAPGEQQPEREEQVEEGAKVSAEDKETVQTEAAPAATEETPAVTEPAEKTEDAPAAATEPAEKTDDAPPAATEPAEKTDDAPPAATEPAEKTDDAPSAATEPAEKTDDAPPAATEPAEKTDDAPPAATEPAEKTDDAPPAATEPAEKTDDAPAAATEPAEKTDDAPPAATEPAEKTDDAPPAATEPAEKTDDAPPAATEPAEKTDDAPPAVESMSKDEVTEGAAEPVAAEPSAAQPQEEGEASKETEEAAQDIAPPVQVEVEETEGKATDGSAESPPQDQQKQVTKEEAETLTGAVADNVVADVEEVTPAAETAAAPEEKPPQDETEAPPAPKESEEGGEKPVADENSSPAAEPEQ